MIRQFIAPDISPFVSKICLSLLVNVWRAAMKGIDHVCNIHALEDYRGWHRLGDLENLGCYACGYGFMWTQSIWTTSTPTWRHGLTRSQDLLPSNHRIQNFGPVPTFCSLVTFTCNMRALTAMSIKRFFLLGIDARGTIQGTQAQIFGTALPIILKIWRLKMVE